MLLLRLNKKEKKKTYFFVFYIGYYTGFDSPTESTEKAAGKEQFTYKARIVVVVVVVANRKKMRELVGKIKSITGSVRWTCAYHTRTITTTCCRRIERILRDSGLACQTLDVCTLRVFSYDDVLWMDVQYLFYSEFIQFIRLRKFAAPTLGESEFLNTVVQCSLLQARNTKEQFPCVRTQTTVLCALMYTYWYRDITYPASRLKSVIAKREERWIFRLWFIIC